MPPRRSRLAAAQTAFLINIKPAGNSSSSVHVHVNGGERRNVSVRQRKLGAYGEGLINSKDKSTKGATAISGPAANFGFAETSLPQFSDSEAENSVSASLSNSSSAWSSSDAEDDSLSSSLASLYEFYTNNENTTGTVSTANPQSTSSSSINKNSNNFGDNDGGNDVSNYSYVVVHNNIGAVADAKNRGANANITDGALTFVVVEQEIKDSSPVSSPTNAPEATGGQVGVFSATKTKKVRFDETPSVTSPSLVTVENKTHVGGETDTTAPTTTGECGEKAKGVPVDAIKADNGNAQSRAAKEQASDASKTQQQLSAEHRTETEKAADPHYRLWKHEQRKKNASLGLGAQRALERQTDFLSSVSPQMLEKHQIQSIRYIAALDATEREEEERQRKKEDKEKRRLMRRSESKQPNRCTDKQSIMNVAEDRNDDNNYEVTGSGLIARESTREQQRRGLKAPETSVAKGESTPRAPEDATIASQFGHDQNQEEGDGGMTSTSTLPFSSSDNSSSSSRVSLFSSADEDEGEEGHNGRKVGERAKEKNTNKKLKIKFSWYSRQPSDYDTCPREDRKMNPSSNNKNKKSDRRSNCISNKPPHTSHSSSSFYFGARSSILSVSGRSRSSSGGSNSSGTLASLPTITSAPSSPTAEQQETNENDDRANATAADGRAGTKRKQREGAAEFGVAANNNKFTAYGIDFRIREGLRTSTAYYHEVPDGNLRQYLNKKADSLRERKLRAEERRKKKAARKGLSVATETERPENDLKNGICSVANALAVPTQFAPESADFFHTQPIAISSVLALYSRKRVAADARDDLIDGHTSDSDNLVNSYRTRRGRKQKLRRKLEGGGGGGASAVNQQKRIDLEDDENDSSDDYDDEDYDEDEESPDRRHPKNGQRLPKDRRRGKEWLRWVAGKGLEVISKAAGGVVGVVGGHYNPTTKKNGGTEGFEEGDEEGDEESGGRGRKKANKSKGKSSEDADEEEAEEDRCGGLELGKTFSHLFVNTANNSTALVLKSYSDAFFLDHPDFVGERRRHLINAPSYRLSIITFAEEDVIRRELNEQFALQHPNLKPKLIKLTHIRRLKMELLNVAVGDPESPIDISTVAHAIWYLERLIEARRVTKTNRKTVAAVCLLLAIKFWETGLAIRSKNNIQEKIKYGITKMEQRLGVNPKKAKEAEFRVYAALDFSLLATSPAVKRHILRLLEMMHMTPSEYYSQSNGK